MVGFIDVVGATVGMVGFIDVVGAVEGEPDG